MHVRNIRVIVQEGKHVRSQERKGQGAELPCGTNVNSPIR